MSLKSVLLAGLAMVVMAAPVRSEDAVVPDEWDQSRSVGACDAYGPGFALMPGTGTCMKVGGQLRYEKTFSSGRRPGSHGRVTLDIETRN